jgi:hypothetical protein
MKDLGQLQTQVWKKVEEANKDKDGTSLDLLGKIVAEMDRKHSDWQSQLEEATTSNGVVGIPVPPNKESANWDVGDARVEDEDFSGRSVRSFELAKQKVPVGSYKELLLEVIRVLQEQDLGRFETVAPQIRGRGPYFSQLAENLRLPKEIKGKLFVETNLNANLIVTICRRLAEAFGENLKLDVAPIRTRRQKGMR